MDRGESKTLQQLLAELEEFKRQLAAERRRGAAQEAGTASPEQLQHTQRLESLGLLAGGLAHDFNNLLVGVVGHAELAMSLLPPGSALREHLEQIRSAAARCTEVCKQLLAYSGKGKFVVRPLHLTELIAQMQPLLEASAARGCSIEYDFEPDLPAVAADTTQLRQVVVNLVTNAAEAIGEQEGVIQVSVRRTHAEATELRDMRGGNQLPAGDYVELSVRDTGCGMDSDTVQRIFDPFFSTKFTGRGLGLAAVLGIVRSHHGAIEVRSEPSHGSTFRVLLPASDRPAEALAPVSDADLDYRGTGTVLVVDDERAVRQVVRMLLEMHGFAVLLAENGAQAIELYRQHRASIVAVLIDLMMPDMSGEATLEQLRAIEPQVKVIFTSGYGDQAIGADRTEMGVGGFLRKPFEHAAFIRALRAVLDADS